MLLNPLEPEMLSQHKDQVLDWMSKVSGNVSWQGQRFLSFPKHSETMGLTQRHSQLITRNFGRELKRPGLQADNSPLSSAQANNACCWTSAPDYIYKKVNSPVTSPRCPEGSRKLRYPDYMTITQDGGKVVSLTHRPFLPPGNTLGAHFC